MRTTARLISLNLIVSAGETMKRDTFSATSDTARDYDMSEVLIKYSRLNLPHVNTASN